MRNIMILIGLLLPAALCAQVVERPTAKQPAAFAVIVDSETYGQVRPALYEYRDAVQRDGLATYIVHATWKNPEQVRRAIRKLVRRDPTIEGLLLLGDIPVVRVRNAQHMTTAFKMDEQKFPFEESSVTSDRYYDDLGLQFDFIRRDEQNPLHFYYDLQTDSPQRLAPSLYSGRVIYPERMGGDKYAAIAGFLLKAAAEKRSAGRLDNLITYAGDHYNSDDLTVWIDEKRALNEQFPLTDRDNTSSVQLNFRMGEYMKGRLFDQMQRPEVDLVIFNEHGLVDKQQISPDPAPDSPELRMEDLKWTIYRYIAREQKKPDGDPAGAREYYKQKYGLTDAFFAGYAPARVDSLDAAHRRNTVIDLDDLCGFDQQPRAVILHACYNGSFHKPASVASYYIFNPGRTVAVQGNTVNVLQDKWATELIGLLSHGVRIGQWNRLVPTLEGHIIGDPTFRFDPVVQNTLARDLTLGRTDGGLWRDNLTSPYADVVALALRMLADAGEITSGELLTALRESPHATVRMECLKLLSRYRNADFVQAVGEGLYDRHEPMRRMCAGYISKIGDPALLPAAADIYVNYPESQRVNYLIQQGFAMFPAAEAAAVLVRAVDSSTWPGIDQLRQAVVAAVDRAQARKERELAAIADATAPEDVRIAAIRSIRNNNYHEYVPQYLEFVADPAQPDHLRVMMAEALGWFTLSTRRGEILAACGELLKDRKLPPALRAELQQTVRRLE